MYDTLLDLDDSARSVNYYLFEYWHDCQDPRTRHLPFIDISPIFLIIFFTIYYQLVTRLIPNHMKDRQPYDIRGTILLYNVMMALGNLWAFIECFKVFGVRDLFNVDYPSDKTSTEYTRKLIMMGYIYQISKLADLFDTVFFALKKKNSHITLLHLYHHISVPVFGWLVLKINTFIPAVRLFAFMNTFIHFVMYSYYFLSALGPHVRRYLWWKRYITIIQLAQFIVLGVYAFIFMFFQRGYPGFWLCVGLPQPLFFFYMFYDFYRRTYDNTYNKSEENNNICVSNGLTKKIE